MDNCNKMENNNNNNNKSNKLTNGNSNKLVNGVGLAENKSPATPGGERMDEETEETDDEFCVYTYKGDVNSGNYADLPSSFFKFDSSDTGQPPGGSSLDGPASIPRPTSITDENPHHQKPSSSTSSNSRVGAPSNNNGPLPNGELYSPEMVEFLEMDFDPGGSEDLDIPMSPPSSSEVEPHLKLQSQKQQTPILPPESASKSNNESYNNSSGNRQNSPTPGPSSSMYTLSTHSSSIPGPSSRPSQLLFDSPTHQANKKALLEERRNELEEELIEVESTLSSQFNSSSQISSNSKRNHTLSPLFGPQPHQITLRLVKSKTVPELSSAKPPPNSHIPEPSSLIPSSSISTSAPTIQHQLHTNSTYIQQIEAKAPISNDSVQLDVGGVMIWSVKEALEKSSTQIGTSACGATAVKNVLSVLSNEEIPNEVVNKCVGTRLRDEAGDLPQYLFSRARAGATHKDLISGIERALNGQIHGRFFSPPPNSSPQDFAKWIFHWICKGAVPVVTRNMQIQQTPVHPDNIPDAWHHQMVFGISPAGLFLNNPIECVSISQLLPQLTSPSELLVRRADVTARHGPRTDLRLLARHSDPRWNQMNVLGQVVNMLLEETPVFNGSSVAKRLRSPHLRIPADYIGGVTLFVDKGNSAYPLLIDAPDL